MVDLPRLLNLTYVLILTTMNTIKTLIGLIMAIFFIASCGSSLPSVETTAEMDWEYELRYYSDSNFWQSQAFMSDDGGSIAVISPRGFESIDANGGTARISGDRARIFQVFVETTRGDEQLNVEKVNFVYVPHLNAVLEFNYGRSDETVSLISLETGEALWVNEEIRWSLERYQTTTRAIARGIGTLSGAVAGEVASEVLFPQVFVQDITYLIPEDNALLIKTLDGMAKINLESGETEWTTTGLRGGVAAMMYHEDSHSMIFVNSDDNFSVEGLQFTKQLARVDLETGELLWTSSYSGDLRTKVNGIGDWTEDRELDIRLMGDYVILNFFNLEVYSVETGEEVWRTTTSGDRIMDLIAPDAQVMNFFAFPITDGEVIYRVKHGNVGLTGIDVEMEAFELATGERLWETGRLSRNDRIVTMTIVDDLIVLGFDGTGSREGMMALNRHTGEKVWQYEIGRTGITSHFMMNGDDLWAVRGSRIFIMNPMDGTVKNQFDMPDELGSIQDVTQMNNNMVLLGRAGVAMVNMNTGEIVSKATAARTNRIHVMGNRMVATGLPGDPSANVHVISSAGEVLGSVRGSSSRRALFVSPQANAIYELRDGKVRRFSVR